MEISTIIEESKHKTRVLIFDSNEVTGQFLLYLLKNNDKKVDYSIKNVYQNSNEDFILIERQSITEECFSPTIVFISEDQCKGNFDLLLQNITPGGVLIYPKNLEEKLQNFQTFFRKLSFESTKLSLKNDQYLLDSDLGQISLSTSKSQFIKNAEGLKLLAQQLGIMEEAFYEGLLSYEMFP